MCKTAASAAALCVDVSLFHALGSGEQPRGVALLWLGACLRCASLLSVARLAWDRPRPALLRFLAAHALLVPVYETGHRLLRGGGDEPGNGRLVCGGWRAWLTGGAACAAAALFWELTLPGREDGATGEERNQKARVLFVRVLRLYKPDFLYLLGAFVFLSLSVLCEMSIPIYTGKVIDILGSEYQSNEFLSAILFMGLYSLGSSFCAGCRGGLFLCAISSFTCRIKVKLFGALVNQEIAFFEAIKTGELTCRLSRDTTLMSRTVALNFNVLLRTLIKTLGMISLMTSLSWKLTLLVLMETPVTGLIQKLYDTHYQRLSTAVHDSMAQANDAANETVSGIRVVRSFNTGHSEARRYGDRLMDTHSLKAKRDTVRAVYLLARRLSELCMQVAVLHYGRLFIQRGQMTTGSLLSFILYQTNLGDNIRTLIYIFGDMLNSVGAAGKVFEYLDREPRLGARGTLSPERLAGRVLFRGLTFSYPSHPDRAVLQDLSLELRPGKMTALVGPSGEGKSTCARLLERFYEPQCGEILLDGQPLKSYEHRFLHRKIALVSQEPVLFSGSVRDNIAYGLAGCSLEDIQEAARRANAHDFIIQLESGYDTEVGEGGGQLANSEKQRIAIARALVRKPKVLILDEITSSLDTDSENKVQQALTTDPDQTLLVIAHRLKTVERADHIVVIGGGKVQEQGTDAELMELKGTYYKLREKLFAE